MAKAVRTTAEFKKAFRQLNPAQREAVEIIEGPVMVIAGPGTGKTQVLAVRVAEILRKTDTPAQAVLALTFTESGAREMRERLVELMGPEGYYVTVGTFHGFCTGVIREHPEKFVIPEEAEPLSDLERVRLFTKILDKGKFWVIKPAGAPRLYLRALIKTVQNLKREGYSPEAFGKFLEEHLAEGEVSLQQNSGRAPDKKQLAKLKEVQRVFGEYEKKLREMGRYDFEDMINKVVRVFEKDENLLRSYQEKFHYLLADEYQDTNSAQNRLLLQLASYWGEEANIFVVGDDQQSIYRFQGAALENILEFKKYFPKAKVITLDRNYRSQQAVLDAAQEVIGKNEVKLSDYLRGVRRKLGSEVEYRREKVKLAKFPSGVVESFFVGQKIKELTAAGTPAKEIAVIYRNNADANDIADMLSRMSIGYNLEGGDDVLTTGDVERLLTLMRTIVGMRDKTEDLDLFTLLNYEFLELEALDVLKLARFAKEKRVHLFEAVERVAKGGESEYKFKNLAKIKGVVDKLVEWGQRDSELTLVEMFEAILNESGLLEWVLKQPDAVRRLNRLNSLFFQVKQLNRADHMMNLKKFLETVELMKANKLKVAEDDLDIDVKAVRLTTAHKAKGQEWDYVFLTKCYDGKWGNRRVAELIKLPEEMVTSLDLSKKEKNEDERRLFYVALTRAKRGIYISWSEEYENKQAVPAMFVAEIPEELKEEVDTTREQLAVREILKDIFKPAEKEGASTEEKEFINRVLENFRLNPTALAIYLQCPYRFKLNQLFRVPAAKPAAMAYGSAIHKALEKFFRLYRSQRELPSEKYLLGEFKRALEKEVLTEAQRELWQERGEEALRVYLKYYADEHQMPVATERWFGGRFNPVYLGDIALSGKVDKVELVDGRKKQVRVVDYKTGRPRSRNEIEGKTKNSEGSYKQQLVFYQLLSELDRTFGFRVVETQLDFVEADKRTKKLKKETFIIEREEVEGLKKLIREVMSKIRRQEFGRTKDYKVCRKCDFARHCWAEGIPKKVESEGLRAQC